MADTYSPDAFRKCTGKPLAGLRQRYEADATTA